MPKKRLHVIYVPGLGDHKVGGQQLAINTWKWWGVSSELFRVGWADGEAWEPKFDRLLARIDAAVAAGSNVALVGASAGASAVINAYQARRDVVVGVVLLAGKINRPKAISQRLIRANPAFGTSAFNVVASLNDLSKEERSHILSRYAIMDPVVPAVDSRIPGARNRVILTSGHAFTIATQLLFGAPSLIRFLKKTSIKSRITKQTVHKRITASLTDVI